jgi:hypothetical protein
MQHVAYREQFGAAAGADALFYESIVQPRRVIEHAAIFLALFSVSLLQKDYRIIMATCSFKSSLNLCL